MSEECYLLFPSIHHLLEAERVLQAGRVGFTLVPAPRVLTSDCGMAIKFHPSWEATVRRMLAEEKIPSRGIYRLNEGEVRGKNRENRTVGKQQV